MVWHLFKKKTQIKISVSGMRKGNYNNKHDMRCYCLNLIINVVILINLNISEKKQKNGNTVNYFIPIYVFLFFKRHAFFL